MIAKTTFARRFTWETARSTVGGEEVERALVKDHGTIDYRPSFNSESHAGFEDVIDPIS